MGLTPGVRRQVDEIRDALGSSLDIREVVGLASPLLLRLVAADYAALGVTRPDEPGAFDWILAEMPPAFFAAYPEMAEHDFVLRSVLGSPNRVLRDTDMLPRRALERNLMYGRARDLGMPLEHVMSTMLHVDEEWQSGISLYRSNQRAFSEEDREVLECVVPALKHAVRNCRLFGATAHRVHCLEEVLTREGLAVLVVAPSGREVGRTPGVSAVLARWFTAVELGEGGLPLCLLDALGGWLAASSTGVPAPFTRETDAQVLTIRPFFLCEGTLRHLVLVVSESPKALVLPADWQARLTPREIEVARALLRGWDNRLIAEELACAESTIKKHVTRVFDKLGVDQRSQLIARAGGPR